MDLITIDVSLQQWLVFIYKNQQFRLFLPWKTVIIRLYSRYLRQKIQIFFKII